MKKKLTAAQIKKIIVDTLKEHKAIEVLAINIKPLTDIADYMIISTANSSVHIKTLIEKIREKLSSMHLKPIGTEGSDASDWKLIDYGDVIVHVMKDNLRKFYNLEKLWNLKTEPKKRKKETKH